MIGRKEELERMYEMNGNADLAHILFEADPFTAPGSHISVLLRLMETSKKGTKKENEEQTKGKVHFEKY